MSELGYIQIYTGNGKGKTTAAIGLAVRAAGRGKKTYIAQFLKKGEYGEILAIKKYLQDLIVIEQFGLPEFHTAGQKVTREEKQAAMRGIDAVKGIFTENRFQIVVLDEVNVLLHFKILETKKVLEIIKFKPPNVELILTGRYAPEELCREAHLITEMKEVRHYYQDGVPARPGIEK